MSPAKAQAVWLYGSHARGDADALSDVDVLVVSESSDEPVSIDCIDLPSRQMSVTRYTWTEIDGMVDAGSLFLRHLQMEGQPASETLLAKGRLDSSLARLGPYRMARRDVRGFEEVLSDVRMSLDSGGALAFELATLGTVIRHACILDCALAGQPCFSRMEPVRRACENRSPTYRWAVDFEALYRYRMYAEGRLAEPPQPTEALAATWCGRAGELVGGLRRLVYGSS